MEFREAEEDKREKVSDFETHRINPSAANMNGMFRFGKHEKVPATITLHDGGETYETEVDSDGYIDGEYKWSDRAKFTKLFKGVEEDVKGLSSSAIGVLMFVIKNLKAGKDEVRIDANLCMADLKYKSRASVYEGVFGLLKAGFLYRKAGWDGEYFINVNKIFNGQRWKLKENG